MKCRSLHLQDWLLVAAMVLGLGQAVAVTEQVPGGLGQPVAVVIPASPFRYEKVRILIFSISLHVLMSCV